jgi:hypothetical protein
MGVPRYRLREPHHDHHPPNFGDVPWTERDLGAPYDHERAAKEFLDAADRLCSPANAGSIPFDINVITAAQVNATIGVGEPILAMLHELRSRSKEAKKGLALAKIKILEGSEGETYDRSP